MNYICNQADFLNSSYGKSKVAALKNNIVPFYSWYLDEKFLRAFYINVVSVVSPSVEKCYERLLDFFISKKLENKVNDQKTLQIAKQLDLLHSEYTLFDGISDLVKYLPLILLIGVTAYGINAIKK